jgi:hypothetical protein
MLLDKKTAIVYGAAGAIGSAVARACAREGADVHLVGRTQGTLEQVAQRIRADGGAAHVTCLDVLDRAAVEEHASVVTAANGGIDACFNATSNDDLQGIFLTQMQPERNGHHHLIRRSGQETPSPQLRGHTRLHFRPPDPLLTGGSRLSLALAAWLCWRCQTGLGRWSFAGFGQDFFPAAAGSQAPQGQDAGRAWQ